MTGFNLPPGCSVRDIERAFGGDDPTSESEALYEKFDPLLIRVGQVRKGLSQELQTVVDEACNQVDDLVRELAYAKQLLHGALHHLPLNPVCTCTARSLSNQHEDTCPVAGSPIEYGEPTLRDEVDNFLTSERSNYEQERLSQLHWSLRPALQALQPLQAGKGRQRFSPSGSR